MENLLDVRNLKKYFKTPKGILHAVDDVSFTIEKGKTLGVVGESGCGKSTLGRTILNLIEPTNGEVWFEGENIAGASGTRLRKLCQEMQMIFQDPFSSLNPRMTVSETISEPLIIYKIYPKKELRMKKVIELMNTVGLSERLCNSYPHELDGGRRQRIGVARALALEPKFIVCDEPVSALDVSIQAQILNLMQDLQEEHLLTYMFITHDLSVIRHIADDVIVMYLGNIVEKCSADKLFEHQYHPYTKALLSAVPEHNLDHEKNRIILKGEISSPINPPPGCRFVGRCNYATVECSREQPKLIEIEKDHFVLCHHAKNINK